MTRISLATRVLSLSRDVEASLRCPVDRVRTDSKKDALASILANSPRCHSVNSMSSLFNFRSLSILLMEADMAYMYSLTFLATLFRILEILEGLILSCEAISPGRS